MDAERCYAGWDMVLTTAAALEAIRDVFIFVEDDCELSIEPVVERAAWDGVERRVAKEGRGAAGPGAASCPACGAPPARLPRAR